LLGSPVDGYAPDPLSILLAFADLPSWSAFLQALATFTIPPELLNTQKIE
jgi:hypothetical protein